MIEKENLVAPEAAENVEMPTEETPKTYTEDEFNAKLDEALGKKIARNTAKIRKEYDKKYGELTQVLRAGTGMENIEEITDSFKEFYQGRGVDFQKKSEYSAKDIEILARADAQEIISDGYDEVVEEIDRLTRLGADNMTAREKAVFKALSEHRKSAERHKELSDLGVSAEVYNSKEFQDFAGKFNPATPISDIYDIYKKTQTKKEFKTMGSMKNNTADDNGVKDFYSYEEASKFTKKDFDKNPALFKAVEASMSKWK